MSDYLKTKKRIMELLNNKSFDKWITEGVNLESGIFYDKFDMDFNRLEEVSPTHKIDSDSNYRNRVQGRQSWVYAKSKDLDWKNYSSAHSQIGFSALEKYYKTKEAVYGSTLTNNLELLDGPLALYDHGFILFAYAESYSQNPEKYKQALYETYHNIVNCFKHPDGYYFTTIPELEDKSRQQNPHMHFFEAVLLAYEKTNDKLFLKEAHNIFNLFKTKLFDSEKGVLLEFFEEDWTPHKIKGDHVEPGHHFEWVWLLHEYSKASKRGGSAVDTSGYMKTLYDFAVKHGVDSRTKYIADALYTDGRMKDNSNNRMWIPCEAVKANASMFSITKDKKYLDRATTYVLMLLDEYIFEDTGLWIDSPKANVVGVEGLTAPASSFYHLLLSFIEYMKVMDLNN